MTRARTGAAHLCAWLEELGVSHLFGVAGTQNVELFEALRRSKIRAVAATHELAAGFMANGVFRATGRPGVMATIPGPGFTYALPALAEARLDSCAVVHLVGKPTESATPQFQLQDIPQRAMAEPLVKRFLTVSRGDELRPAIEKAFRTALAQEPGPVVVEIARGVLSESWEPEARAAVEPAAKTDWGPVLAAAAAARRVAFYVGSGVNDAAESLRRVAERLGAPVFLTTSARGALAEDHPLAVPLDRALGGWNAINAFLGECDLIVALGVKFSHNGTGGFRLRIPKEKLIHVDAAPQVVNANYPARAAAVGDARELLEAWASAPAGERREPAFTKDEWDRARGALFAPAAGGSFLDDATEPRFPGLDPPSAAGFFAALRRALPRDGILATDSGLHQLLARKHFPIYAPRGLVCPTDFQSMGFAIPAAMAAKLAAPRRKVVALLGDAGFAMAGLELLTAVREKIPLTAIVFADGFDGLIRLKQLQEYGRAFGTDLANPDFEALAGSLGIGYALAKGNPEPALAAAIASKGVTLVEVRLADSPQLVRARAKGTATGAAESVLGEEMLAKIRRTIRKLR